MLRKILLALLALLFPFFQVQSPAGFPAALAPLGQLTVEPEPESDSAAQLRRLEKVNAALRAQGGGLQSQAVDEDGYILISSAADLAAINSNLGANYRLTRDISLLGKNFAAIGSTAHPFTGILDGGAEQYAIQSLVLHRDVTIGGEEETALGLFAVNAGTVKNIQLIGCDVYLKVTGAADASDAAAYAGAIVGYNLGRVENCYITGSVVIENSAASAAANFSCSAGGAIGFQGGTLNAQAGVYDTLSEATATITGSGSVYSYAGGVVGFILRQFDAILNQSSVLRCVGKGNVAAQAVKMATAGGVVGQAEAAGRMEQCAAFGSATARSANASAYAGGVIGYLTASSPLVDCVAFGDANAHSDRVASGSAYRVSAGGLVGGVFSSALRSSYATGIPTATGTIAKHIGGGIGYEYLIPSDPRALSCYYKADTAPTGVGTGSSVIDPLTAAELQAEENYLGFDFHFDAVWGMCDLEGIGLTAYLFQTPELPARPPAPEPKLPVLHNARTSPDIVVDEKWGLIYGLRDKVLAEKLLAKDCVETAGYFLYVENPGYALRVNPDSTIMTGFVIRLYAEDGTALKDYTCIIFGDCVPNGKVDRDDVSMAINLAGTPYLPANGGRPSNSAFALMPFGNIYSTIPLEASRTISAYANDAGGIAYSSLAAELERSLRDLPLR